MGLVGNKQCHHCAKRIPVIEAFKVSMGTNEISCSSCGKPFTFSQSRKWIAIFVAVIIVFSPNTLAMFEVATILGESGALLLKYVLAGLVFYLINGSEK